MTKPEFFGHCDGAITDETYVYPSCVSDPYTATTFSRLLCISLLLSRQLTVPALFALHNKHLRRALVPREGQLSGLASLLRDESIVIAHGRSSPSTFSELEGFTREQRLYGVPERAAIIDYANVLDDVTRRGEPYDEADLKSRIAGYGQLLLTDLRFLRNHQLADAGKFLRQRLRRSPPQASVNGFPVDRSWYFEAAQELDSNPRDAAKARRVRALSSTLWHLAFTTTTEFDAMVPLQLGPMMNAVASSAGVSRSETYPALEQFDARSNQLFASSAFLHLDWNMIREVRGSPHFRTYQTERAKADRLADPFARAKAGRNAIDEYFARIQDLLTLGVTGHYEAFQRSRRFRRIVSTSLAVSGAAAGELTLIFVLPPPVAGGAAPVLSLAWTAATTRAMNWLERRAHERSLVPARIAALDARGREKTEERRRPLQVGGVMRFRG